MTEYEQDRADQAASTTPTSRAHPASSITYEGVDVDGLRKHDGRWRKTLFVPGDKVRPYLKAPEALREAVGSEPLEVANTIVRGEGHRHLAGRGDTASAIVTEYEFKGVVGRFDTMQFQHERGAERYFGEHLAEPRSVGGPALTIGQITDIVANKELGALDDKELADVAQTVTAARAAAEREGGGVADPTLLIARNAVWAERANRTAADAGHEGARADGNPMSDAKYPDLPGEDGLPNIRDTNTLEIVKAATRIVSAISDGGGVQAEETFRSTARSIDAAVATGVPLDDAFVARTVWNMTRGSLSRAYESVMPEHGPLISRAAAFQTHPDDLRALVADGWSAGAEDIPTYSRLIDGTEWQMTQASGRWDVTRPEGGMLRLMLRESTAGEAIRSVAKMTGAGPDERAAHDATSALSPTPQPPSRREWIAWRDGLDR